jgi:type III restriction enzyme
MLGLLDAIEAEIRANLSEYEGARDFHPARIHQIFTDKRLKFSKDNPRLAEEEQFKAFVSAQDWFAFETAYGTSEERAFVRMLDRHIQKLQAQYEEIYLLRNEGHFAIYNFADGQALQPDFVLFLKEKNGQSLTYQLFIEPKGAHLKQHDQWKADFLRKITEEFGKNRILQLKGKKYRLIGVPFYNNEDENAFRQSLDSVLN